MYTVTAKISPDDAREYLAANFDGNRNISQRRVDRYANDMREGRWQLSHQGIAFDTDSHLIDGQHRLAAVAQSGVTVEMNISYDVPRESFTTMDQHHVRTVASFMTGKNAGFRAALLRAAAIFEKRDYKVASAHLSGPRITPQEVIAFAERNQDAVDYASQYSPLAQKYGVRFGRTTGAGLLVGGWAAELIETGKGDEWWRDILDLCEATRIIEPGHPIRLLVPGIDSARHASGEAYMNAIYVATKYARGAAVGRIAWRNLRDETIDILGD